jgi:oxaloacetate decarboxylase beta subunit
MASRVTQRLGQEADRDNYLLMHAVGANVAGQIGSVIAGGILLAWLGG